MQVDEYHFYTQSKRFTSYHVQMCEGLCETSKKTHIENGTVVSQLFQIITAQ